MLDAGRSAGESTAASRSRDLLAVVSHAYRSSHLIRDSVLSADWFYPRLTTGASPPLLPHTRSLDRLPPGIRNYHPVHDRRSAREQSGARVEIASERCERTNERPAQPSVTLNVDQSSVTPSHSAIHTMHRQLHHNQRQKLQESFDKHNGLCAIHSSCLVV